MTECPIECVSVSCPDKDFIERNGTWLLTVIAGFTGCFSMLLTYFLKSRCSNIKFCGVECVRDVVALKPGEVEVISASSSNQNAV
jgi:hypothetical protein